MKKYTYCIMLLIYLAGYNIKAQNIDLDSLKWMTGVWISEKGDKSQKETWERLSANVYSGKGMRINNQTKEILAFEDLLLTKMGTDIFYIAKVAENEYPVSFKLTEITNDKAVFENPTHDFPQKLIYTLTNKNELLVEIKAGEKGFFIKFLKELN